MVPLRKQCLSEFLCSLLVCFLGLGCAVPFKMDIIDLYEFAIIFGLVIAFIVIIFNPMSGAQFNPGVTLAMVLTKRQDKKTLPLYWGAQLLGWFCGAGMIYGVFNTQIMGMKPLTQVTMLFCNFDSYAAAIPLEACLTALLVIVILACNDQRIVNKPSKALFPLFLAFYILLAVTLAGNFSGAALNAARDIGPRIFAFIYAAAHGYTDLMGKCFGDLHYLVYLLVPTAAAVLGAYIYDLGIARLLPKPKVILDTHPNINPNYIKEEFKSATDEEIEEDEGILADFGIGVNKAKDDKNKANNKTKNNKVKKK